MNRIVKKAVALFSAAMVTASSLLCGTTAGAAVPSSRVKFVTVSKAVNISYLVAEEILGRPDTLYLGNNGKNKYYYTINLNTGETKKVKDAKGIEAYADYRVRSPESDDNIRVIGEIEFPVKLNGEYYGLLLPNGKIIKNAVAREPGDFRANIYTTAGNSSKTLVYTLQGKKIGYYNSKKYGSPVGYDSESKSIVTCLYNNNTQKTYYFLSSKGKLKEKKVFTGDNYYQYYFAHDNGVYLMGKNGMETVSGKKVEYSDLFGTNNNKNTTKYVLDVESEYGGTYSLVNTKTGNTLEVLCSDYIIHNGRVVVYQMDKVIVYNARTGKKIGEKQAYLAESGFFECGDYIGYVTTNNACTKYGFEIIK